MNNVVGCKLSLLLLLYFSLLSLFSHASFSSPFFFSSFIFSLLSLFFFFSLLLLSLLLLSLSLLIFILMVLIIIVVIMFPLHSPVTSERQWLPPGSVCRGHLHRHLFPAGSALVRGRHRVRPGTHNKLEERVRVHRPWREANLSWSEVKQKV